MPCTTRHACKVYPQGKACTLHLKQQNYKSLPSYVAVVATCGSYDPFVIFQLLFQ